MKVGFVSCSEYVECLTLGLIAYIIGIPGILQIVDI